MARHGAGAGVCCIALSKAISWSLSLEPSPVLVPHAASEYHCTVMYPIDDECAHTMPVTIAACASAGLPAGTSRPYCERSTEHTLAFVAGLLQSMHLPVSTDQALVGVPEHVVSAAANEPYEVCEVLPGEPTVPPALLEGAGAGGKAVKVKVGVVGVGAAAGSGAGSATGAGRRRNSSGRSSPSAAWSSPLSFDAEII